MLAIRGGPIYTERAMSDTNGINPRATYTVYDAELIDPICDVIGSKIEDLARELFEDGESVIYLVPAGTPPESEIEAIEIWSYEFGDFGDDWNEDEDS